MSQPQRKSADFTPASARPEAAVDIQGDDQTIVHSHRSDDIFVAAGPNPKTLQAALPVFGAGGLAATVVGGLVPGLMALAAPCVLTYLFIVRSKQRPPRLRFEDETISVAGFGRVPYRALREAKVYTWSSERGDSAYLTLETYWPLSRSVEVEADRTHERIWKLLEPKRIAIDLKAIDVAPAILHSRLKTRIGHQAAFSNKRPW